MSSNRRFYKCRYCRERKGKCQPEDRRWEHHGPKERCNFCRARNLPCGPNLNTAGDQQTFRVPNQSMFSIRTPSPNVNGTYSPTSTQARQQTSSRAPPVMTTNAAVPPWRTPTSNQQSQRSSGLAPAPQMLAGSPRPMTGWATAGPRSPSYAQVVQRPPSSSLPLDWLSDVDAQIELHTCFCYMEHSLNYYRRAQQRPPSIAPDDKENVIQNLLGMLQGMISDRSTCILHAIKYHAGSERMSLLEQLHESLEHFLSNLRFRDTGQDCARPNSSRLRTNVSPRFDLGSQSRSTSSPIQHTQETNSSQGNIPSHLSELLNEIANAIVPEYITTGSHVRAYRVRRLSSATTRLRPPDEDRFVHDSELDLFLASFGQVNRALSIILQHQPRYARCLYNGQNTGLSPGHVAMLSKNRSIAHALYERGDWGHHDLDFLNRGALHWAAELGDLRLLYLIDQKDPQAIRQGRTDVYGLSPLCLAAMHGHLEVYKFLYERGADPGSRDPSMKNALFFSASMGHLSLVEHQLGTCFTAQDSRGFCSALHASAAGGHTEVAMCLFEAGASMEFQGHNAATVAERYHHRHLAARLRQAERERFRRDLRTTQSIQDRLSSNAIPFERGAAAASSSVLNPASSLGTAHVNPTNFMETASSSQNNVSDAQDDSSFEFGNLSTVEDFLNAEFARGGIDEESEMYEAS